MAVATSATSSTGLVLNGSTSNSSSSELDKVMVVKEWFNRAREARRPLVNEWKRNYKVLNNAEWRPGYDPTTTPRDIAHMWPIIASMVAWMTDQRPILQVMPAAQPYSEYAEFYQNLSNDMNVALQSTFSVHGLSEEITKVLWDVHTYGIGYTKTQWEPWLADSLGDVVFRRVDPFCVYPDPLARDWNSCEYIIEAKHMTLSDVFRSYPESRNKELQMIEDLDYSPHRLMDTVNPMQPRTTYSNFPGTTVSEYGVLINQGRNNNMRETQQVTVLECWYRDYSYEGTTEDGNPKIAETWNCLIVCGNTVLMDYKAEEVNAHGQHPFDKMTLFANGEWYGPTLVSKLASCQHDINAILNQIKNNIALMGNPILVESPRASSHNIRVTNTPGQRFTADPSQVAWMNPPQMHPQMAMQLVNYLDSKMESISGMSAIVRGFQPSGRNAQGVLDSVQDAAFVRIRSTLRQLELLLMGVCAKMSATIAEFYVEPRLVALWGPDGKQAVQVFRSSHFYTPDTKYSDDPIEPEDVPMRFLIMADAGSQQFISKQAREAQAEKLFAMGAIDELEMLKAANWPNYAVVSRRVQERKAAEAAAANGSTMAPAARQRAQRSS